MKTYDVIERYIVYRRSLGEKYTTSAYILRQYYNYIGKILILRKLQKP